MKVRRQLEELGPLILERVEELDEGAWFEAPSGKWSIAQIVGHVALGVDVVAGAFEDRKDKAPMTRRANPKQSLFRHIVLLRGRMAPGATTPRAADPGDQPDPEQVMAALRMGIERLGSMLEQWPTELQNSVYVRHPVLGDMNLPEWIRFHLVHGRHHARQIDDRKQWLSGRH